LTGCAQPSLRKSLALERTQYNFFPPILAEIFCAGGTKKRWRFDSVDAPWIEADFQVWRDQRDWTAEKYRSFNRHEPMPPDCRASG
jgi:hypothetical protein